MKSKTTGARRRFWEGGELIYVYQYIYIYIHTHVVGSVDKVD